MDVSIVLALMYAGILLIVGFTALNKSYMSSVMNGIAESPALIWVTGFVTFLIGIVSLALYHAWTPDWRVIITIAGWATLLKGIVLTLFPKTSIAFYRKAIGGAIFAGGVVAIILGVVLLHFAFMAS